MRGSLSFALGLLARLQLHVSRECSHTLVGSREGGEGGGAGRAQSQRASTTVTTTASRSHNKQRRIHLL